MRSNFFIYGLTMLGLIQLSFGQQGIDNESGQLVRAIGAMSAGKQQSIGVFVRNTPIKILGSYHVFDTWKNNAVIHVSEDKVYKILNINVNVKDSRFESKVSKDSVYTFDAHAIDHVVINGRKFKNMYVERFRDHKICEVIVDDDTYMIFKVYRSDIKKNDPDPLMIKPNGDEFVVNSWYHIKRDEKIEKFKLNKKNILRLFVDNKNDMESFVKDNRLSWNNVEDFQQMYQKWKTL